MARRHQFGLGQHLRDHAITLLLDVARANRRSGRLEVLDRMCDSAECLKVLLEHGRQLQAFGSFAEYGELAKKTVDVARQAEGWRRYTCSGPERPRRPSASEGP